MKLAPQDLRDLQNLLLETYTTVKSLELVLSVVGWNIEDVTTDGTRPQKFLEVLDHAAANNWLQPLLERIFILAEQQDPPNLPLMDQLADLFLRIWPLTQEGEPHQHLLTTNFAFVNRDRVRDLVASVVDYGTPSVLLLNGAQYSGTSYCWALINHVAREVADVNVVYLNFDQYSGDSLLPYGIMSSVRQMAGFPEVPLRNDLLTADGEPDNQSPQLTLSLCQSFLQQAGDLIRDQRTRFWLVLDNTHRDRVPPETKELVKGLANQIGPGAVNRLALFVLGTDQSASGFYVEELEVPELGRQDIKDYLLRLAGGADGPLGDFGSVQEALENITQGCDFANPDMTKLSTLTKQLTAIARHI